MYEPLQEGGGAGGKQHDREEKELEVRNMTGRREELEVLY